MQSSSGALRHLLSCDEKSSITRGGCIDAFHQKDLRITCFRAFFNFSNSLSFIYHVIPHWLIGRSGRSSEAGKTWGKKSRNLHRSSGRRGTLSKRRRYFVLEKRDMGHGGEQCPITIET